MTKNYRKVPKMIFPQNPPFSPQHLTFQQNHSVCFGVRFGARLNARFGVHSDARFDAFFESSRFVI